MKQQLSTKQQSLLRLGQNLQHLNPQAVLIRGYAFVQDSKGSIINSSTQLKTGDEVKLTLSIGSADAIISKTNA
jgi:exodeoxyribonuclease VII large subunit